MVLTSDNPRSEEPMAIIEEALVGVRETRTECIVEEDRAEAIEMRFVRRGVGILFCLRVRGMRRCRYSKDGSGAV